MKENEEYQRLEDYLMGRLDTEEHRQMEEMLQEDQRLAREAEQLQVLFQGISMSGRRELKSRLQSIEKTCEKKDVVKIISWRTYGIAATIVLLLAGGLLFLFYNNEPDLNVWYQPYPVLDQAIMRSGANEPDALQDALQMYETGNYLMAAESLQKLQVDEEKKEIVQFYLASAWQAGHEAEKALPLYKEITENGKIFRHQAQWYLSLCYIQLGKTGEAENELKKLSSGTSSYASKAAELLESLP
ncbi:MAG: hypothetical protein JJU28_14280 [Cyclobacteriaceae bacterium]|nr:hypothetical protein [Cyclobacteriaceae bacterium]